MTAISAKPATLLIPGSSVPGAERPSGPVSPEEFLNRDTSWLEFNRRVLHEALDERTPLLERLRFLGIFTSNLDEFFMKRAALLRRQAAKRVVTAALEGRSPADVFAAVRRTVLPMLREQAQCYTE